MSLQIVKSQVGFEQLAEQFNIFRFSEIVHPAVILDATGHARQMINIRRPISTSIYSKMTLYRYTPTAVSIYYSTFVILAPIARNFSMKSSYPRSI